MNESVKKKIIAEIEKTSPVLVKLKGDKTNPPRPVHFYGSKEQYVPDVEVRYSKKKNFYIFEPEIKDDNISRLLFKWILFSSEAKKTTGNLYLVIKSKDRKYCDEVIADKQLDIELIEV